MAIAETPPADVTGALATGVPVAAAPAAPTLPDASRGRADRLLAGRAFVACCVAADAVAVLTGLALVAGPEAASGAVGLVTVLLAVAGLAWRGLYDGQSRRAALDLVTPVAGALLLAGLLAVAIVAGVSARPPVDATDAALAALLATGGVLLTRALLLEARRRACARGALGRPTVILGAGEVGARIATRLLGDPSLGLRPVGFVDAAGEHRAASAPVGMPLLGTHTELAEVVARTGARELIVAFPAGARDDALRPAVAACARLGVRVSVVPRLFEAVNGRLAYEPLGGLPLHALRAVDPDGWRFAVKHGLDVAVAAAALVVLAPLLALISLAVRLESPGPVIFRQRRVGRDGQVFDLLKFRSMRLPDDQASFVPAPGCAPGGVEGVDRRTRVGRLLRRTSLDELPQLVNVVRGEMSLVGPRPERPEFVALFEQDIRRYGERQRVRSGLTGWAQVNGFRGQTSLAERIEYDNYYIEHWSLGLDLKILVRTAAALLNPAED